MKYLYDSQISERLLIWWKNGFSKWFMGSLMFLGKSRAIPGPLQGHYRLTLKSYKKLLTPPPKADLNINTYPWKNPAKSTKIIKNNNKSSKYEPHHPAHTWLSRVESLQDFLIKLDMKPRMHLVEISIISLNNVTVTLWTEPTRIGHILKNWSILKITIFKNIFH